MFRGLYGDIWIEDLLTNLPGGKVGLLVVANLADLRARLLHRLLRDRVHRAAAARARRHALGIDLVWFGVVIGMNLQTSFLTPPFGFSLFYLRGVAPDDMPTTAIYRGAIPFIGIQAVGLLLVVLFPSLVTLWL